MSGLSGGSSGVRLDRADRIFFRGTQLAAILVLGLILAIFIFLLVKAYPSIQQAGWSFVTEKKWFPDNTPAKFGVAALAFGTILSSLIALLIATPIAIGSALFVTNLAPKKIANPVAWIVDLLAAVPSVVFGLWGVFYLVPKLSPIERWVDDYFGFIPFLHSTTGTYGRSIFAASVILAIMILPIISSLTREVFMQVPRMNKEAALALGATRWEMIKVAVLPYGRSGVIGAAMLGLGRALGETIAVALVLAAAFNINFHIFEPGGNTIAANIATKFGEAGEAGREALIASGLVLFLITFAVNLIARLIIKRTAK